MYLVFSLLRKESKVTGVKRPILKSSCTGGSIYYFHETLTLLADEEIIKNKNQVPPSKGKATLFFLSFNFPETKNI